MLTPQVEEKGLHDKIVQGQLILAHMDVDEQDRPQLEVEEPQPEAEEGYGNAEEPAVGPSTTLLKKLALKVDNQRQIWQKCWPTNYILYTF